MIAGLRDIIQSRAFESEWLTCDGCGQCGTGAFADGMRSFRPGPESTAFFRLCRACVRAVRESEAKP